MGSDLNSPHNPCSFKDSAEGGEDRAAFHTFANLKNKYANSDIKQW